MNTIYMGLMIVFSALISNPNERVADAHFSNRNIPEAIHYYTEALKEDSENAILYFKRARAHLMIHQYDAYNKDIARAIELDPQLPKKLPNRELIQDRSVE